MEFFVHSTTRNAPYVHPRLDSIIELYWAFSIGQNASEYDKEIPRITDLKPTLGIKRGDKRTWTNKDAYTYKLFKKKLQSFSTLLKLTESAEAI